MNIQARSQEFLLGGATVLYGGALYIYPAPGAYMGSVQGNCADG